MKKGLTKWDKLPVFSSFQDEMNRVLDSFFNRESPYGTDWRPVVDVAETESDVLVKAEIPGIDPKDIDVSITGEKLTLKGEKKEEKENTGKCYHRVESSYGSFKRVITLPASVDVDKVTAEGKNGILEITLPKKEESKAKKINVKVD
ncbi:MAG: Hsp20/alpha crystallin family protein [Planctomycetota bacterium]